MSRASMRPRKGDLLIRLRDDKGDVTILIERDKVRPHHVAGLKKLFDIVSSDIMRPPADALVEKVSP